MLAYDGHHRVALGGFVHRLVDQEGGAQVAGQDQQSVAEVNRAPLTIRETAIVEHLQQDVEDLWVSLLHLVEEYDAVGTPAHGFGELATLVIADIAGRRPDQPSDRMLLGVFAHVDAHNRALVVVQEVGQGLGQLGLAHTRGAQEEE